jgi:hypothetical protein
MKKFIEIHKSVQFYAEIVLPTNEAGFIGKYKYAVGMVQVDLTRPTLVTVTCLRQNASI